MEEKEFNICVVETWKETIPVKAKSPREAVEKFNSDYENGRFDFSENAKVKCETVVIGK